MHNSTPSFLGIVLLIVILNILSAQAQSTLTSKNLFLYNQYNFNFESTPLNLDSKQATSFHTKTGESVSERVVFEILFFRVATIEKQIAKQKEKGSSENVEFLEKYFQRNGKFSDEEVSKLKEVSLAFVEESNSMQEKGNLLSKDIKAGIDIEKKKTELSEWKEQRRNLYLKYANQLRNLLTQETILRFTEFLQNSIASKVKKGEKSPVLDSPSFAEFYYFSDLEFNPGPNNFWAEAETYFDYSGGGPFLMGNHCDEEANCNGAYVEAHVENYDGIEIADLYNEDCGSQGWAWVGDFVETDDLQSGDYCINADHGGTINLSTNCAAQGYDYNGYSGECINVALPPHITGIGPTGSVPGVTIEVVIEGTNFGTNPTINVSGSGVTTQVKQVISTGIVSFFQIAENADLGNHNVTVTTNGKTSNAVVFTVGDRSPQIANINNSEGNTGETVPVTISGSNFGLNPIVQIDGTGVTPIVTNSSTTQITALFSVADATYAGQRGVTVKSLGISGTGFIASQGTSDTSNSVDFEVFKPMITITPFDSLESNGKKDVTITISNGRQGVNYTASIRQGNDYGFVVFDENSQPNINFQGSGQQHDQVKTLKIRSEGPSSSSLNDWKFSISDGNQIVSELFTVVGLQFEKATNCSGFDPNGDNTSPSQPYLFVPQNGNNTVKAKLTPNGATGNFNLSSSNSSALTFSPSNITSNDQIITINGRNLVGDFDLNALGNEAANNAAKLKVSIRKRINKTVVIHAVTEDNDDVQSIPVGQGEPNQIAIQPNGNTLLTTQTGGDDQIITIPPATIGGRSRKAVSTGSNGIRETQMVAGDFEVIQINKGKPNSICVSVGNNLERDSKILVGNDDYESKDGNENVLSGSNGICETTANNTDIVPNEANIPSASALQTYLNDTTWGRQANIFFTVTRDTTPHQVNFDLDLDGVFSQSRPMRANEYQKISDSIPNNGMNTQLFYTGVGFQNNFANAEAVPPDFIFFSPNHYGTINYIGAHELGHTLMPSTDSNSVHSPNLTDLMYYQDSASSPCEIKKRDWDLINIDNPQFYFNEGVINNEK